MNYLELRKECFADPKFFEFILQKEDLDGLADSLLTEWGVELSPGVAEAVRRDLERNPELRTATLQALGLSAAPGPCQIRWPRFHA